MQINVREAKKALRKPAGLTVAKATADARKLVNRIMPNVNATVESKLSHDLKTDTPTVVTIVTFPFAHACGYDLGVALETLGGTIAPGSGRYTITRKR